MKMTIISAHLIQLTHFPHLFPVNMYLVREDDGFTLVDTGIPGRARAILSAARTAGAPIRRIALTHGHADHTGALDELCAALPGVDALISAREARLIAGDRSLDPSEPQAGLRGSWQRIKTKLRTFLPGDRIGSLEVIATPGHTPGHVAFLDLRDRTLIAGDAFQTRAGVAVSGTLRVLFPFPAMATWHKPTALESARVLRALEPSRLAVGHGRVLTDPLPAMDNAIAAAARHLSEVQHRGA